MKHKVIGIVITEYHAKNIITEKKKNIITELVVNVLLLILKHWEVEMEFYILKASCKHFVSDKNWLL